MHEKELEYFQESLYHINNQFYVDAIKGFQDFINEFPQSDLVDDSMYNTGLCYYEMNQFKKSIEVLEDMIQKYPDATITSLGNANESGKTAAKAYYLIVQCYLGLGDIKKAESVIPILEGYNDTYVEKNAEKFSFAQLADDSIIKFKNIK